MKQNAAYISVALFATVFIAFAGAEDYCGELKAAECVESYMISGIETCEEMETVTDCLRIVVRECYGELSDPAIEEGLENLQTMLKTVCPGVRSELNAEKCADENKEYIMGCLSKSIQDAYAALKEPEEVDMNLMKCVMHLYLTECTVERVTEKCGKDLGKETEERLKEIPEVIKEACSAPASMEFMSNNLFDDKK